MFIYVAVFKVFALGWVVRLSFARTTTQAYYMQLKLNFNVNYYEYMAHICVVYGIWIKAK